MRSTTHSPAPQSLISPAAIAGLFAVVAISLHSIALAQPGATTPATAPALAPIPAPAHAQPAFRGVWLRPVANLTSATLQLDNIQKAGFDVIYLETFYHGFTIYPSRFVPIRPEMEGTDYLKLYLDEGRKRGIQIHPWIEVFYWQVDTEKYPQFPRTPLFDAHPEWKAILRDGRTTEWAEPAHIFANPANPAVRDFIVAYLEELLHDYPVAGLNLDYIRYPDGSPDAGYDELTLSEYKKRTGVDAATLAVDPADPKWRAWVEFREEQVLKTVRAIKAMKDRTRKDAILSAAIFPGPDSQRYTNFKFQNWKRMLEEGSLDAVAAMCYDYQLDSIEKRMRAIGEVIPAGSGILNLPVLAVQRKTTDFYSGAGHPPMNQQMAIVEKLGLPGFSVFCYDWIVDSAEGLTLLKGNAK